jgi:hypothetical protein
VELYVYYRAPVASQAALEQAVDAAQRALVARHPALEARLLRRPEAADGQATWMEIYRHPRGIDRALEAEIETALQAASSDLGAGPRHIERFIACAS